MLSFWWLFSWRVYIFPANCWVCSHDINFVFSIKSCGSVDWFCLAHDRNSEHCAAIGHYFLQKKSSLFQRFFCISDSVSCNAVNLYTAAIISFYATWNGSNSVQFHVVSEHNCHYCGAFTELRWLAERRAWFVCNIFWGWKWGDLCASGRDQWCNRGRESRANDIFINKDWSWGRCYACWVSSMLHRYPELPVSLCIICPSKTVVLFFSSHDVNVIRFSFVVEIMKNHDCGQIKKSWKLCA